VADEYFHQWIIRPEAIEQAIALWEGHSLATIPGGKLVCQPVNWNCPWSWYVDPDRFGFGEVGIEICDGRPSYVEAGCSSFADGTYCPWGAVLIELRDCRTNPACPMMPR